MQASQKTVSELLHGSFQYVVPLFQRYYCWGTSNWDQLWSDLMGLMESEDHKRHFLGSLVTVVHRAQPGSPTPFHMIDGQQRLTTLSTLLCSIRDAADERGWVQLAAEANESYLIHRFKRGQEKYKLFPRQRDRDQWFGLVDNNVKGDAGVVAAYRYFRRRMAEAGCLQDEASLRALMEAVTNRVELVAITLDGENPYRIFKSLNSTGVDLEQGDLIRNHVFMAVEPVEQDEFDERYWRPVEQHFESDGQLDGRRFAGFLRDVLLRSGEYIGRDSTYDAFDRRYPHGDFSPREVTVELKHLAELYDIIAGRKPHADPDVTSALQSLGDLQVSTAWPVVLRLLEAEASGQLEAPRLARGVRSLSSFVLRRLVCGESSRAYGRWFCVVCKELGSDPVTDLERFLSNKGWPTDRRFISAFVGMDLYHSKYCRPILDAIERELEHSTEPIGLDGTSVEHVMPQTLGKDEHGRAWKDALGDDWKDLHPQWLDTPGNLTLVGHDYNSGMRNVRYSKKLLVLGDKSVLALNRYFDTGRAPADWSAQEIEVRGRELATIAARLWPKVVDGTAGDSQAESEGINGADESSLRVDDIVRVLTRAWVPRGQRLFLKMMLSKDEVTLEDLYEHVASGRALAGLMAALSKRINGTNLRSTGSKPGLSLMTTWEDGKYRARPELQVAITRLPELDSYLRESTWEEARSEEKYIRYELA